MNYSDVFEAYELQGWDTKSKLILVLDFFDDNKEISVEEFYIHMKAVVAENDIENKLAVKTYNK